MRFRPFFALLLLFVTVAQAPAGTDYKQLRNPSSENEDQDEYCSHTFDPLEPINRGIFAFNHQLTRFILRPLAKVTEFIIPRPILNRVINVFDNVETPVRVAGSLLQADFKKASKETGKLLVNSTVGIGGIFKPSEKIPALANVPAEDVGQAFAKWGIPPGPYLVLPVLGPSNLRDLTGRAADTALNPITWIGNPDLRLVLNATENVAENPRRMQAYKAATEGALDRYIVVREGYLQYRASVSLR